MPGGLTRRILIGALVIALLFVVQFVLTLMSLQSIHRHTKHEQHAEQSIVGAVRIEKLVIDLSIGTRGYVLTQDRTFLTQWQTARAQLPAQAARLLALAPGRRSRAIDAAWRSYLRSWSAPLIREARVRPARAKARVSSIEGLLLISRIRNLIDPFVSEQDRIVEHDRAEIAAAERRGTELEVFGAVIRIALFLLIFAYLLRFVIAPLRRLAAATKGLAAGEVGVEVPEEGAGEVGDLARSFNEMSRSLTRSRAALGEQNVDLERLANVLRAVLDSTIDGILLSDADGHIQLANRPLIALTRDLDMTFEGTVVDRLLSVADRMADPPAYREAMERLRDPLAEPTFDEFEDVVSGRVFQGFTAPVHDDRGGFLGRIWTLREVTQQRELDKLKDEFVATVSHELRTPLTSMMGFLEMLREGEAGELSEEQKRFLAIVYRSSERLQRLVGDLLFVARLDVNGLQLRYAPVDVADVVRETVESTSALARNREIELRAELAEVPDVSADRERLAQLVGNLVSNALKFTPAGGWVAARAFRDDGNVVLEVEDSGIGIPYAEQPRLFQRFFRSSTATEQAIPGTGLGLVISKAIAEAHGGSISVRSAPGTGTAFRVELPVEREET
jgi:two-component system sensor histidine kinase ResE